MTDQPAKTERPKRVQLFVTCLVDQFRPEVGESVVNVLERLGIEVDFPEGQTCCGQPAFNSGFRNEASDVARHFLDVFDATEGPIVVPSGSCGAMVRNFYGEMFEDDSAEMRRSCCGNSATHHEPSPSGGGFSMPALERRRNSPHLRISPRPSPARGVKEVKFGESGRLAEFPKDIQATADTMQAVFASWPRTAICGGRCWGLQP